MKFSDFQKGVGGNVLRITATFLAGYFAARGINITADDLTQLFTSLETLVPVIAAAWGIYNKFKVQQVVVQQAAELKQPVEVAKAKVASPYVNTPSVNTPTNVVPSEKV